MSNEQFTSVWDAIEDTPEEAENMKLRSGLMVGLKPTQVSTTSGCPSNSRHSVPAAVFSFWNGGQGNYPQRRRRHPPHGYRDEF